MRDFNFWPPEISLWPPLNLKLDYYEHDTMWFFDIDLKVPWKWWILYESGKKKNEQFLLPTDSGFLVMIEV